MANTDISDLRDTTGFLGACLVDSETGLVLAQETGSTYLDLEAAGARNTEVMRAKNAALKALGHDDPIEDIVISLGTQIHLIRPLHSNPTVFVYLAVERKIENLGMARLAIKNVEAELAV
ncbi:MAG: roadblock/LC7 domain-containing protein [Pseudomonadota bacterium]